MLPEEFKICRFVDEVKDLSLTRIVQAAEQERRTVERQSFSVKGARAARKQGSLKYVAELNSLLDLLLRGKTPSEYHRSVFRPIIENLIKKNELPPGFLK